MSSIEPRDLPAGLDAASDKGLRHEVVDGLLIVSYPPSSVHQQALDNLFAQLTGPCPEHLEVLREPTDFRPSDQRRLLPDLLVVPSEESTARRVAQVALVVEVIQSTTRMVDQLLKRALYEETGVPAYWMLDAEEAILTVLELEGGRYVERAVVREGGVFEAEVPFPVRVLGSAVQ